MIIDKAQVKRILVITLSNIGDIILTTPVIRTLRKNFPSARIDVMAGPAGKGVFERDPDIFKLIIYDKRMPISQKRRLQLKLKKLRYDIVADLKNTVFPLLIGPRLRTATIQKIPANIVHARDKHLYRLRSLGVDAMETGSYIFIPEDEDRYIENLLKSGGISEPIVVVNPGAKSHLKRWTDEGFAQACDRLMGECAVQVVFVGLNEDRPIVESIIKKMKHKPGDLVERTNIRQLASLLKRSKLVITNDSAPLHLACAVKAKVLALFGPTDPKKYGPTGEFDMAIQKKLFCSPCEKAACAYNYECMKSITPDEVFETARMMLEGYE